MDLIDDAYECFFFLCVAPGCSTGDKHLRYDAEIYSKGDRVSERLRDRFSGLRLSQRLLCGKQKFVGLYTDLGLALFDLDSYLDYIEKSRSQISRTRRVTCGCLQIHIKVCTAEFKIRTYFHSFIHFYFISVLQQISSTS